MYITSNQLLIMVIGNLQFPDINEAKNKKCSFNKMIEERKAVNIDLLLKFAVCYTPKLKSVLSPSEVEHLKIEFPTPENTDEWHEYFKMQEDGSFLCKTSRLRNLLEEVYALPNVHSPFNVKEALEEALTIECIAKEIKVA